MVRVEHIAMYAKNLEKVRVFFMRYFGATSNEGYHNPKTDFRSYFLSFDHGARLEIMNKPRLDDPEKVSDCCRTLGSEDLLYCEPGGKFGRDRLFQPSL